MPHVPARISPLEAQRRLREGVPLLDLREPHEHALGLPQGAVAMPRGRLEAEPSKVLAHREAEAMLICASGRRAQDCAGRLAALGYHRLLQVEGGFEAWQAAGLPVEIPATGELDFYDRYARHLRLAEVGEAGQRRLQAACITLVGAGGLGSPAAFYLAAAGVGRLRLIDADRVERSNLQRQILHSDAAIGMLKIDSARERLAALNPTLEVEGLAQRLDATNAKELLSGSDVVIDGSDNFPTRYAVNDACLELGLPWVYGAVERFRGQLSVFDAGRQRGRLPCYRCLFPEPPAPEDAPNCSVAGVLGVLPGLIGLLQATEAIKLILGIGRPLAGRVLDVDALGIAFREFGLPVDPGCRCAA